MGVIQCGSFTGNTTVTIGWEPQWIMIKRTDSTGDWIVIDSARGCSVGGIDAVLNPNLYNAESVANDNIDFTATGFISKNLTGTYIYTVIRRPNKPPTSGTQVYNAIARTGTGAAATVNGVGFAPDASIISFRADAGQGKNWIDRLRGNVAVSSASAAAEYDASTYVSQDTMDGIRLLGGTFNNTGSTLINHFFRRAPGFMDVVCYTGTGSNKIETHSLTVQPELWLIKRRNSTGNWVFGSTYLTNTEKVIMPSPNGRVTDATVWNSTYPTSTNISLGTSTDTNAAGGTYVGYLFASLAGISKVGTYTGNGASLSVNMGFSAGCRFFMVIRLTASTAQDIFIWDSVRGIVSANDPHLSLNSTAAEVTTDDSVDPFSGGITVNQVAATNINVSGAEYLYLAIA